MNQAGLIKTPSSSCHEAQRQLQLPYIFALARSCRERYPQLESAPKQDSVICHFNMKCFLSFTTGCPITQV